MGESFSEPSASFWNVPCCHWIMPLGHLGFVAVRALAQPSTCCSASTRVQYADIGSEACGTYGSQQRGSMILRRNRLR
jgi:hypothetical protein